MLKKKTNIQFASRTFEIMDNFFSFIFIAEQTFNLIDIDIIEKRGNNFADTDSISFYSIHILFCSVRCVCARTEYTIKSDFLRRHHHNIYIFQFQHNKGGLLSTNAMPFHCIEIEGKKLRTDIDFITRYIFCLLQYRC